MTHFAHRWSLLLRTLIAAAVVCAGVALEPAAAGAAPSSVPASVSPVELGPAQVAQLIPPKPSVWYHMPRAFRDGKRKAIRHYYGDSQMRDVAARCCDFWEPSIPGWIKDAAERVVEKAKVAKWYLENGLKCAAAVVTIGALAHARIAQIATKIARLAKSDKSVRRARRAINKLGGIRSSVGVLARYAKSKGDNVTETEKYWIGVLVKSGGTVIAGLLGMTSCYAIGKRLLS